jgi:hypothetical protein
MNNPTKSPLAAALEIEESATRALLAALVAEAGSKKALSAFRVANLTLARVGLDSTTTCLAQSRLHQLARELEVPTYEGEVR